MFAKTTRVRSTRQWVLLFFLAYVFVGTFPALAIGGLAPVGAFLLGQIAIVMAGVWLPRRWAGEARADERGFFVAERLLASRASIHSAYVRTWRGRPWLRLRRRFGTVDVALNSPDEEAAWLAALRLDATGVVARYFAQADRRRSLEVRIRAHCLITIPLLVLFGVFGAIQFGSADRIARFALAPMFAMLAVQSVAAGRAFERVWIGADGLRLQRLLGRARFLPFSSIASVGVEGRDVVVALHDGSSVAWHGPRWAPKSTIEYERAVAERIERGLRAHRDLAVSEAVGHLARSARSIDAWVRDLRHTGDPDRGSYRVAAVPRDDLWKAVENANALPTARAGAAVALQRGLDDQQRKRLCDVASTCASEPLRAALEAICVGQRLEEHLAAVQD